MKVRGIVVKIKDSHCLVLASDGTYHKVPLSHHKGARVGGEIEFALNNWNRYVKPALLVASILIIALSISLFQQVAIPPAFAYVSLDINPSVELEVGPDLNVIAAHPLNKDAENLLANVKVSGQQLYDSVNSILAEAVQEGFLKPGQKNYVLSTVTLEKAASKNIDYEALTGEMRVAVQDKGIEVELLVLSTDSKLRKEAKSKGISPGKLVVYRQAIETGENVTLQQVKENSITNLVNNYKIKIIPLNQKIIIKSLEIKPRDMGENGHQTFESLPGPENDNIDKEKDKDKDKVKVKDEDEDKDKPNRRHRNPKDDEQVSAPAQKDLDDDEGVRQSVELKKSNEPDKEDYVRDKDGKPPDSGHMNEKDKDKEKDNDNSSKGNNNSRGEVGDNNSRGEVGDNHNTQDGDKSSNDKGNSR